MYRLMQGIGGWLYFVDPYEGVVPEIHKNDKGDLCSLVPNQIPASWQLTITS